MTYVTEILADESGVQYQGVKDKTGSTGTYPITGLIVGYFRRGRFDKPMTITNANIRAMLGYDPKNPSYMAVQDALSQELPSVQVLRIQGDYFDVKPAPIFGSWILNPGVSILNGVAAYTGYKTNTIDTYDSYANLDLTAAIVQSLHDNDMQQWQAVKDACTQLTGAVTWTFDNNTKVIKYFTPQEIPGYGLLDPETNKPTISTVEQLCSSLIQSQFKNSSNMRNAKYSGFTQVNYSIYCDLTVEIFDGYDWNTSTTQADQSIKIYQTENVQSLSISYQQLAQKIISNASSSNQAISLLAEAYLEAVANSIFNADESKRFVKLTDLDPLFETNKMLRVL